MIGSLWSSISGITGVIKNSSFDEKYDQYKSEIKKTKEQIKKQRDDLYKQLKQKGK